MKRVNYFAPLIVLAAGALALGAAAQTVPVSMPVMSIDDGGLAASDATVAAAAANAVASLRNDIYATRMLSRTTVADFVRQTGSDNEISLIIQKAQQIGPPRWIDDQTCQVKMEISGGRVAQALVSIAHNFPKESPVGAELLSRELRDWRLRSFTATGSASGADRVFWVRPTDTASDAWKDVDEPTRKAAIVAAKQNVAGKIIDSIKPVELTPGKTVADALGVDAIQKKVVEWINSRPVTGVRFQDDRSVSLTLSVPPDGLAQTLAYAVAAEKGMENVKVDLARLTRSLAVRMAEPTGSSPSSAGNANKAGGIAEAAVDFTLPSTPPEWVYGSLDGEGAAPYAGSRLLTARVAEDNATDNLRLKLLALPLDNKHTVADASKVKSAIARAVSRAMLRARVSKAEYQPDGGVSVKISLDPRVVWDEIGGL